MPVAHDQTAKSGKLIRQWKLEIDAVDRLFPFFFSFFFAFWMDWRRGGAEIRSFHVGAIMPVPGAIGFNFQGFIRDAFGWRAKYEGLAPFQILEMR